MPKDDLVTATRFAESRVQNYGNELLGHVKDVVLDPQAGRVTHVLVRLAAAPLLGPGKLVLVPWEAFTPAYNDQVLVLQAKEDELTKLPEAPFDLTHRGLWVGAPQRAGASASFMV